MSSFSDGNVFLCKIVMELNFVVVFGAKGLKYLRNLSANIFATDFAMEFTSVVILAMKNVRT